MCVAVLLDVQEQQLSERSFKARLERRLALLLEEGLRASSRGRWKRATAVGNNSLQVSPPASCHVPPDIHTQDSYVSQSSQLLAAAGASDWLTWLCC